MNNNLLGSKTESYSASYSYTKIILALATSNNSSSYYFYIKNMGVEPLQAINIDVDNPILSYADSTQANPQIATITATHSQGTGKTVNLYNASDDSLIGAMTDNGDGTYEYEYRSQGIGDLTVYAKSGTLLTKTFAIQDCWEYYDGSSVTGLSIDSGVSCTSNGSYITITKNTSGEEYVYLSKTLTNSDNWEYSVELAQLGTAQSLAVGFNDVTYYGGITKGDRQYFSHIDSNVTKNKTPSVGDVYKVIRENGVTTVKINDETIDSKTVSHKTSFKCGFYTNNGKVQNVKNIKLKPL